MRKTQVPFFVQKGERVAIIDDDPGIRMQWEILLERTEISVDCFDSWESFLFCQKSRPREYGTMVIDYNFENSRLNGGDILKKLKFYPVDFFYLCTADYLKPEVQQLAQSYNAHLYPKPISNVQVAFVTPKDIRASKGVIPGDR